MIMKCQGQKSGAQLTGNTLFGKRNYMLVLSIALKEVKNPLQDGGGPKRSLLSGFFPVTSTNVRINHENFLNFSSNPFTKVV